MVCTSKAYEGLVMIVMEYFKVEMTLFNESRSSCRFKRVLHQCLVLLADDATIFNNPLTVLGWKQRMSKADHQEAIDISAIS